ncbi:LysR substrate-binding domain-containing protein [Coralliovum pocilloporae]|uniref:LysR substrate-binding domain-containing protein n=1 Tax=Coralliovum pocilloporae TaxID=3066369 RepID=UPI0033077940
MRYAQLRAFHYVAISGGFSKAAEALNLTQPGVSDQVRKLEDAYDVTLFRRQGRVTRLTELGHKLLQSTGRMFEAEAEALEILSETRALRSGHLNLMSDSAGHILPILGRFQERYPQITLTLKSGNSPMIVDALFSFQADIGILADLPDDKSLYVQRLRSDPVIAFVAQDHPLAARTEVSLRELAAWPLILREPQSKTRKLYMDAAEQAGLEPHIAIEAEGREAVREIVATGVGYGVVSLPELGPDPRLKALSIADTDITMEQSMVCPAPRIRRRLVRAFFDVAEEAMKADGMKDTGVIGKL